MSRYKQIVFGEKELEEINGVKYLIYPTLKTKVKVLEIFKNSQRPIEQDGKTIKGDFDLDEMINVCTEIVYEACFDHDEKGNRTGKKEDEKDTSEEMIKFNVIDSGIFELYMAIASSMSIISQKKKEEITKSMEQQTKN